MGDGWLGMAARPIYEPYGRIVMPTIDENIEEWGSDYEWPRQGDDWSQPFGGTQRLWWGIVHPRVMAFLPAEHILEIAPGHGRMTQFLLGPCQRLTAVDLNASCIAACRDRFAGEAPLELHVNDGRSLDMVADRSIDFAFSFDSRVHVDADVMGAYLLELSRALAPDGVAFLHHSNAGAFLQPIASLTDRWSVPALGGRISRRLNRNWRSAEVSAEGVAALAAEAGLRCVVQESVNWLAKLPSDCFSTVTRVGSRWDQAPRVVRNLSFMREAARLRRLAELYDWA